MKFCNWYFQALGGITGIVICVYCYLRGNLLIYSSLNGNFDAVNFNSILGSYLLYPLCFLTFIMSIVLAIYKKDQKIINIKVDKINTTLIYLTIIIGILSCNIYFIIPTLLLLIRDIIYIFNYNKLKYKNRHITIKQNNNSNEADEKLYEANSKLLSTKTEMAINLLNSSADIDFITEVTGLSEDYINRLKLKREDINKKK